MTAVLRPAFALLVLSAASPVLAERQPDERVAKRSPDAQDIAMTPLTDLNLRKDELPAVLIAAADDPYESKDLRDCAGISAALEPLDAALGPDMDVGENQRDRLSTGSIAKSFVASFIPFRSILREVTGAADHRRQFEAAIYAGAVRRGFLKGLGQQMNCPYPARPAFARVVVEKPDKKGEPAPTQAAEPTSFVSQPVVQVVPSAAKRTARTRR